MKKKIFSVLFALVLVVSFSLVTAVPAMAATEVWVDDDADSGWYDSTHFATIQEGINAVAPGGTVNVAAGTYNENVDVNKTLTLEGAQAGKDPTVEGARTDSAEESTIDAADSSLPAIKITADSVIIDGFTLTGGNPIVHISDAASVRSGITISNNVITGATDQDGIWLGGVIDNVGGFGVDNVTIVGNTITNNGRKGIFFYNGGAFAAQAISNITISGNVISDNGQSGISTYGPGPNTIINNTVGGNGDNGISIKYDTGDVVRGNTVTNNGDMGINMHAVTNCLVENNTVSGHVNDEVVTTIYGPPLTVGKGSGIYIHELSVGNTIRYNDITGNNNGVFVNSEKGDLPSGNSITYNNIAGNIHYGVLSTLPDTELSINATNNWWGHASGPSGPGGRTNPDDVVIGKGDAVSDNVEWDPWLRRPVWTNPAGKDLPPSRK